LHEIPGGRIIGPTEHVIEERVSFGLTARVFAKEDETIVDLEVPRDRGELIRCFLRLVEDRTQLRSGTLADSRPDRLGGRVIEAKKLVWEQ